MSFVDEIRCDELYVASVLPRKKKEHDVRLVITNAN